MLRSSTTRHGLNVLSHDSAFLLIQRALDAGYNIQQVYVDTVGDPQQYENRMKQKFPQIHEIIVSKKADSLYPIVSAASIIAKVSRDRQLEEWRFQENSNGGRGTAAVDEYEIKEGERRAKKEKNTKEKRRRKKQKKEKQEKTGGEEGEGEGGKGEEEECSIDNDNDHEDDIDEEEDEEEDHDSFSSSSSSSSSSFSRDFGSGYPGDDRTKSWLESHFEPIFGFPSLVRFSWQTSKKMMKEQGVKVEWGDEDEEEEEIGGGEENGDGKGGGGGGIKKRVRAQKMESFFSKMDAESQTVKKAQIPMKQRAPYFQHLHLQLTTTFG